MNSKINIILLLVAFITASNVKREIQLTAFEGELNKIDEKCLKELAATGLLLTKLLSDIKKHNLPDIVKVGIALSKQIPNTLNVCRGAPSLNIVEAVDPQCFSKYIPELNDVFNQFNSDLQNLDISAAIADLDAIRAVLVKIEKDCDHSFNF